jgi:hypothetical protein
MWDLWWTEWHWGRLSASTSISSAKHPTDCCTPIIIHHHLWLVQQASTGLSNSGLGSTPPQETKKRISYTHIFVAPVETSKSSVLFIYGLFNDLVNASDYIASDGRMINE